MSSAGFVGRTIFSLIKERNYLFLICAFLLLSNLALAIKILSGAERVVIVPAYQGASFWVDKADVSAEALQEMALFFLNHLLDTSPDSFAFQTNIVLKYVTPNLYSALKEKRIEEEKRYKKEGLSTSFRALRLSVLSKSLMVQVTGVLSSYLSGQCIKQSQDQYQIAFSYKDGRLLVKSLQLLSSEEKNEIK